MPSPYFLSIVVLILVCPGCHLQNYAERGAAVGGLTGGGLGAVVGEVAGDEPVVGAVVGSAVGALTGASVGTALDEVDARNAVRVQQAMYAQQASGTSLQEIFAMSDAGLSDDVITRHVRTHGFHETLDAADLIALRQQGVSDSVIASLQQAASQSVSVAQTAVPAAPPVIVEERYHAVPHPWHSRWRYRHGPPCPPGPRVHWGFAFGH